MFKKKAMVIDGNLLIELVEGILEDPPVEFDPNDFKDKETYERDTKVFMEGFKAALTLIHDLLSGELSFETTDEFES